MSIPFFYPPQPMRIWPESDLFRQLDKNPKWDAEIKYNGWRLLVFIDPKIRFFNRQGTEIDINKKPFEPILSKLPTGTILDGELVHFRTTDLKNTIVFWDAPFYNGTDQRKKPLRERRYLLEHFGVAPMVLPKDKKINIFRCHQFNTNMIILYKELVQKNDDLIEGIVIKNIDSLYEFHLKRGIETRYWIKIKKIGNHAKV